MLEVCIQIPLLSHVNVSSPVPIFCTLHYIVGCVLIIISFSPVLCTLSSVMGWCRLKCHASWWFAISRTSHWPGLLPWFRRHWKKRCEYGSAGRLHWSCCPFLTVVFCGLEIGVKKQMSFKHVLLTFLSFSFLYSNLLRVTKASQLQSVGEGGNNNSFLGKQGQDFEFSHLGPIKVEFVEAVAKGRENLTPVTSWLQQLAWMRLWRHMKMTCIGR